jgi:hypothetical protein
LFSIENYGGATLLPTVSGLSLGSRLDDAGWNQTAFSLTYLLGLGEGTEVKLVYGNGEGESGMNLDPQQYFGFHLKVEAIKGIEAHLGLSRDFNSQGSLRQSWLLQKYRQECEIDTTSLGAKQGYLTNRLSAALVADSIIDAAPGLKMALGWQRNVKSDLNKFTRSDLGAEELANCPRIDVNHFFIESPGDASANIVEANVFGFNAAYHFLSSYFIAFDYEQRTINSRDVKFFQPCERFVGTSCETGGKATQSEIKQTAYTYGGGVALSPSLILTLEYNTSSFDQMYNKVFYEEPGEAKQSQELFNARIAYQWDKER